MAWHGLHGPSAVHVTAAHPEFWQAVLRGWEKRTVMRERAEAAARLQAVLRGKQTREMTDDDMVEFRALARLQAVWCAAAAHSCDAAQQQPTAATDRKSVV